MKCSHHKRRGSGTPTKWSCLVCGKDITRVVRLEMASNRKGIEEDLEQGRVKVLVNAGYDPNLDAAEFRDPDRPVGTSGFVEEGKSLRHAQNLRNQIKDGTRKVEVDGMRHEMAVPTEVYWHMRKRDKDFWSSKRNRDKFKDYRVS